MKEYIHLTNCTTQQRSDSFLLKLSKLTENTILQIFEYYIEEYKWSYDDDIDMMTSNVCSESRITICSWSQYRPSLPNIKSALKK